jgi:hypothetical protein
MSAGDLLDVAVDRYLSKDNAGLADCIVRYEERRKDGAFEPMQSIKGDVLRDLLVDLFNTKEALAKKNKKSVKA